MHELGIVNYVVRQVERVAAENELTQIESVTLEFGEVSGIVTSYLIKYWKWYTDKDEHSLLKGSELICETLPAVTFCNGCGRTYSTLEHGKTCPYCGSGDTWLKQGQEMNIREIAGV